MKKLPKATRGPRPERETAPAPAIPARTVGVLGLGIIGSRVAEACRRAGVAVVAWNRTRRRGQPALTTPMEVAQAARVLQIFVTDDAALASVVEALLPALTKHHVVLNCSTVSLDATRAAAAAVATTGAAFLDAPFTGSKNAAAAGELVYYIGGPAAVLERVRWALEPSAKAIVPLGRVGDATVIKIATNLVSAIAVEALSEALGIVTAHGIGADAFLAAMEHNANSSGLSRMKLPGMVAGRFEPHFSLKNMWKDAGFAEQLAQAVGTGNSRADGGPRPHGGAGRARPWRGGFFRVGGELPRADEAETLAGDRSVPNFMTPADVPLPTAGWIDLSGRAKFRLSGPDRVRYLNGQVTNNVARLREGEAMPALVCTAKGRLEGEVVIRAASDHLLLDAPGSLREPLLARLEKYLISDDCAWEDVSDEFALWHGLGMGGPETVSRFGPPGRDLWLPATAPPPDGPRLTTEAVELLRLIHGVPVWGAELTAETLPQEARLEDRAVDFHKGCYVGQEVVSRLRSVGRVNRLLCRLETVDDLPLTPGTRLFGVPSQDDEPGAEVGVVTSAQRDPERGVSMGLGYVKRAAALPGATFQTSAEKNALSTRVKCRETPV